MSCRPQPYRLDPPVNGENIPQIVQNADEMFQILFEDMAELCARLDVDEAAIAAAAAAAAAAALASFRIVPGVRGEDGDTPAWIAPPPSQNPLLASATIDQSGAASTPPNGLILQNVTPATAGTLVQVPPLILWSGTAWDTAALASKTNQWKADILPVSGNPTREFFRLQSSIGGAAFVNTLSLTDAGFLTVHAPTVGAFGGVIAANSDESFIMRMLGDSSLGVIGTATNHALTVQTNAAEVARFTTGGFFGIKTTPLVNFVVSDSGSVANFEVAVSSSLTMQAFNRTTGAYATYNMDGAAIRFRSSVQSGSIFEMKAVTATSLNGAAVGLNHDMSTNYTPGAQNITGYLLTLPTVTVANTNTYKGVAVTQAALTNSAGTTSWTGVDVQMPAITQSGGTLTSTGIKVTGGTVTSGTSRALVTDATAGPLSIGAKFDKYNNITTAGWGVPAIYGSGRSTAQTAAVASVATYTVGASDGSFMVSANVNVTTSTTHNFTVTVAYTDETNTARTLTVTFSKLDGTLLTAITDVTGAGPYSSFPLHIRCKAATAITIATVGTFTTVTYNVEGSIEQIS